MLLLTMSSAFAVTDDIGVTLSTASNTGGGGYVIIPTYNVTLEYVTRAVNNNADDWYLYYNTNGTFIKSVLSDLNNNIAFNIDLEAGVEYRIWSDKGGVTYNRQYLDCSAVYEVTGTNIVYHTGWHAGLNTENTGCFNIQSITTSIIVPNATFNNFSTIESASYEFTTSTSIGSAFGVINTLTLNNSQSATAPYYFASSFTTNASTGSSTAECRITIDGTIYTSSIRTLSAGTLGNFKLITPPVNLSLGEHTVNTECRKTFGTNYKIKNSQLTQFHLYDTLTNTKANYKSVNGTGFAVTTTPTLLYSFNFTTSNTTNTTNINSLVLHGRASYSYGSTGDITTYAVLEETGETCGLYTRGGSAGSTGSVGTTCLYSELNSSTTYNIGFYGYTSIGVGTVNNVLMNAYELQTNESAVSTTNLSKVIPANTTTEVANITINNVLGGTYNVFLDAGIIASASTTQQAYFYINNSFSSINYYRTLTSSAGNINTQVVFSNSGTGNHTYTLYAYCPSGCTVTGGDLTAFVTDADSVSTGIFNITAYNNYNSTAINSFNVTIGGTTYFTTNGTVSALGQGTVNVLVENPLFFSNTTSHDTTINLNAGLTKYVEITASNYGAGAVTNFTVNSSVGNYTTTNGVAYLPVVSDNTSVTINGETIAISTEKLNKTQFYTFNIYAENSLFITFKNSVTDSIINNINIDYFSTIDSDSTSTSNGTLYLTLLNPVTYTFRINSTGYDENIYFTTITDDTFNDLTIYLNPNSTSTTITVSIVDSGASPLENAIVKALKYYVSDNTYRIVASGITNPAGETQLDLITANNFYKFVVVIDDVTVKTTSPFIITGTTVKIQVKLEEDVLNNYNVWKGISSSLTFNKVTDNFRADYTDIVGVNREVCLSVYQLGFSSDTLLNTTCVTGTSGTLISSVTNTSDTSYRALLKTTINDVVFILEDETYTYPRANYGTSGLIAQIFLTLIMSISGFIAIELIFIIAPLSIIIGGLVGFHTLSLGITITLVIVGVILMFMLRRNG